MKFYYEMRNSGLIERFLHSKTVVLADFAKVKDVMDLFKTIFAWQLSDDCNCS